MIGVKIRTANKEKRFTFLLNVKRFTLSFGKRFETFIDLSDLSDLSNKSERSKFGKSIWTIWTNGLK